VTGPARVLLERDPAHDGRIAHLVLNRPEALNAIDNDLANAVCEACETLAHDQSIWVVIVRGNGDRAFCAGADVKLRLGFSDEQWWTQRTLFRRMFALVRAVPQPMIAAVHGYALGGGAEIAMLADFIVAADDAVFGLTETHLGIIPGGGGTQNLPRLVGRNRAKELIYCARRFSAAEAERFGLVNRVVPRADLVGTATAIAREIMANGPLAVRLTKRAIDAGADLPFDEGLEREEEAYRRAIVSHDRREGIAAFNAKRAPEFTGT